MVEIYNSRALNQVSRLSRFEPPIARPWLFTHGKTNKNIFLNLQGLSEDDMIGYHGDLCVPTEEDPAAFRDAKFFNFEMACVGLGFHHFDNPALAAKRLVARLRAGGVLMILDFLPHGVYADAEDHHHHGHGHGHGHSHGHSDEHKDGEVDDQKKALKTVTHHGFSEESIKEIFVEAGAGKEFAIEKLGSVTMGMKHGKRDLFMARGTKG